MTCRKRREREKHTPSLMILAVILCLKMLYRLLKFAITASNFICKETSQCDPLRTFVATSFTAVTFAMTFKHYVVF